MYVVAVTVHVKHEFLAEFIQATMDNARNTRGEPANLRFDVSQCLEDPDRFLLYEVYGSADGLKTHQQTEHYLRWKQAVADWMSKPREGVKHKSLFYGESRTAD